MNGKARIRLLSIVSLATFLAVAAPAASADEGLALVPTDAASVGLVRLDQLRSSALAPRIFENMDRATTQGEAARFIEEAGLDPRRDVDVIVASAIPGKQRKERVLVTFEGRFDPARLSAAVINRGATVRVSGSTEYYLITSEQEQETGPGRGAVAFVSRRLVVAGDQESVARALSDRQAGGSGFLSGEGLGSSLSRIDRGSSAWALVDARRFPAGRHGASGDGGSSGDPTRALVGAMKSVTLYALEATARPEELEFAATGVTADEETRELLVDALKGVIAAWRIAASDKHPDLVPVLRRFSVESDGDAVTISGKLPASLLQTLAERRHARNNAK
jgi:hypothetical protein